MPSGRFEPQTAFRGGNPESPPVTLTGLDDASALLPTGKTDAVIFLKKARTALAAENLVAAIGWYKSAAAVGATFAEGEDSPARLYNELVQRGVSADQLELTPITPTHLPPPGFGESAVAVNLSGSFQVPGELKDPQSVAVNGGDSISSSSLLERAAQIKSSETPAEEEPQSKSERQRVMQLIAQAQAAIDRGDVDLAEQFALCAQELRLPEAAYLSGDTRPWMVLMEISKAQRRRESAPAETVVERGVFTAPAVPANVPQIVNNVPQAVAGVFVDNSAQQDSVALTQATRELPRARVLVPASRRAPVRIASAGADRRSCHGTADDHQSAGRSAFCRIFLAPDHRSARRHAGTVILGGTAGRPRLGRGPGGFRAGGHDRTRLWPRRANLP